MARRTEASIRRGRATTDRDGGDTADGTSATLVGADDRTGQTRTAEQQLIGCLLWCRTAEQALLIVRAVPADAVDDTLNRAILAACRELAEADRWKQPADVALHVHRAGFFPRDLCGSVHARVCELYADCLWPQDWRLHAAELVEMHARRQIAAFVSSLALALSEGCLEELAARLDTTADAARRSAQMVAGLTDRQVPA